ncbi:hypothetical protein, partial [uncultured Allobaculum sp.]|uniref:hypothetical protein n=1 Tax=uncultured Allobaculum sp. TaxID=1187017 RepID=UPI00258AB566
YPKEAVEKIPVFYLTLTKRKESILDSTSEPGNARRPSVLPSGLSFFGFCARWIKRSLKGKILSRSLNGQLHKEASPHNRPAERQIQSPSGINA